MSGIYLWCEAPWQPNVELSGSPKLALNGAGGGMYQRTHDHRMDEEMEQSTRRMDRRALGLGMLIGAAIGAGAALLLAPASGEDTRRQLKRGARRLYARGADAVTDLRHDTDRMARRLARRGLKRSRQLMADVREGLPR